MQEKFTNTSIAKLKRADKPYEVRDAGHKGLLLRVQPNGRKYFYFHLELPPDAAGRRKRARFNLGEADGALSVEVARSKCIELMAQHQKGEEPAMKRKAISTNTFSSFLEDVYRSWLHVNLEHGEYAYTTLKTAFAEFLDLPLVDITPGALESWRTRKLQEVNPKTGKPLNPNTVNRQLSDLKACLHHARDIW